MHPQKLSEVVPMLAQKWTVGKSPRRIVKHPNSIFLTLQVLGRPFIHPGLWSHAIWRLQFQAPGQTNHHRGLLWAQKPILSLRACQNYAYSLKRKESQHWWHLFALVGQWRLSPALFGRSRVFSQSYPSQTGCAFVFGSLFKRRINSWWRSNSKFYQYIFRYQTLIVILIGTCHTKPSTRRSNVNCGITFCSTCTWRSQTFERRKTEARKQRKRQEEAVRNAKHGGPRLGL